MVLHTLVSTVSCVLQGVIDVVKMKAIVWSGEELGAKFDEVDIPADYVEISNEYREKLIDTIVELDDQVGCWMPGTWRYWNALAQHACTFFASNRCKRIPPSQHGHHVNRVPRREVALCYQQHMHAKRRLV